jgi:hypothetical protein
MASNLKHATQTGVPDDMTANLLNQDDAEGYIGVRDEYMIQPATVKALKVLQQIREMPRGDKADMLDALVCSNDAIWRRTLKKQYRRCIYMVTNAAQQVEDTDQLGEIIARFSVGEDTCLFNLIGIDFASLDLPGDVKEEEQDDAMNTGMHVLLIHYSMLYQLLLSSIAVSRILLSVHNGIESLREARLACMLNLICAYSDR